MARSQVLFFILGGFFITNALVAELIGGKIFSVPMPEFIQVMLSYMGITADKFNLSMGVVMWPIVFVATDIINEFFGRKGVRFYTFATIGLILYTFFCLTIARMVPATDFSPITDQSFNNVFGTSQLIIIGSILAFAVSQLFDVFIFSVVRRWTGSKMLWARSTGSTVLSQLLDTFVVGGVGLYLPGIITLEQYLSVSIVSYLFKVAAAIAATPLCYAGHAMVEYIVGQEDSKRLAEDAHGVVRT